MYRFHLKRMCLDKGRFTSLILFMFIVSFIILMLADSETTSGLRWERNLQTSYHQGIPPMLGQIFYVLKRHLHQTTKEDHFNSLRNNKEYYNSLKTRKKLLSAKDSTNWTNTIKQWRKSVNKTTNYSYLINNENLCKGLSDQRLVVLIYSAIHNNKRRESLRNTWADSRISKTKRFSIAFLLGNTTDTTEQNLVNAESDKYGDIVQGDFLDVYQNLAHKGLFGFQWVMEFCQNARFVLKVDDDVFLDIFKILENYANVSHEKEYLACQVREIGRSPILRDGRWKLDEKYFPGQTFYPFRHCNGYFVALSTDIVARLLELSKQVSKLWIDDVYLFGLLPSKLESLNMTQLANSLSLYETPSLECFGDLAPCRLLVSYTYNQGTIEKLWKLALFNSYTFVEKYGNTGYIFMKTIKLTN